MKWSDDLECGYAIETVQEEERMTSAGSGVFAPHTHARVSGSGVYVYVYIVCVCMYLYESTLLSMNDGMLGLI